MKLDLALKNLHGLIYAKKDLVLNNLQGLICHKTQQYAIKKNNQPTNQHGYQRGATVKIELNPK